jgi:hypothetical protein
MRYRRTILCLALLASLTLAPANVSGQNRGDAVKVAYDGAKDITTVSLETTLQTGGKDGTLRLFVYGSYTGQEPQRPELLTLTFFYTHLSTAARFKESRPLTMTVDGRRYEYGDVGMYSADATKDGAAILESMTALINFDALQDAALGKDVQLALGGLSAKLTPEQLRALRKLVSKFQPRM